MYAYQTNNTFFAQVPGMMEELCEQELIELGAKNTRVAYRGIYFEADLITIYRINYTLQNDIAGISTAEIFSLQRCRVNYENGCKANRVG